MVRVFEHLVQAVVELEGDAFAKIVDIDQGNLPPVWDTEGLYLSRRAGVNVGRREP
jgi:hypothetical protein